MDASKHADQRDMPHQAASPEAPQASEDLHLDVLIIPPTELEGQNMEQNFTAIVKRELQQPQRNGQIAHGWQGPVVPVRVKQLNAQGREMTVEERQATEVGRRITAAAAGFKVPIVFFYEKAWMMLRLENPRTGIKLWQVILPIQLPEDKFPRAPLASTVREVTRNGQRSGIEFKVKAWEMFDERFEWTGEEKKVQLVSTDDAGHPFSVLLTLQRVQNAATKEPLTHFQGERVWGMRSIAVVADEGMWKQPQ